MTRRDGSGCARDCGLWQACPRSGPRPPCRPVPSKSPNSRNFTPPERGRRRSQAQAWKPPELPMRAHPPQRIFKPAPQVKTPGTSSISGSRPMRAVSPPFPRRRRATIQDPGHCSWQREAPLESVQSHDDGLDRRRDSQPGEGLRRRAERAAGGPSVATAWTWASRSRLSPDRTCRDRERLPAARRPPRGCPQRCRPPAPRTAPAADPGR